MSNHKPLKDILVVALEQAVAAPFCSSRLADAGARVIKIERQEGDFARGYDHVVNGESAYFVWLNGGKESVCLNLKNDDDQRVLHSIIADADVFIQNLAPGATTRLGMGSEQLRERHPRLITVDISGYGESGPYKDMKAYDLLVQCETGLASITGSPEAPGRVGVSLCDIACGMYAHSAVLEALFERTQTGQGKAIKLSLFECLADWMAVPLLHQDYAGQAPQRLGLHHPSIAPYGAYRCKAGEQLVFSIQNDREWLRFCEGVLKRPTMAKDQRFTDNSQRCEHRAELDQEIDAVLMSLAREEVCERLDKSKIAFGRVNSVQQFSDHPQLQRTEVNTPSGIVSMVSRPGGREASPVCVPAVGEHTVAVREEYQH